MQNHPSTATSPDFRYWNSVDPASFLNHDWANPSREWASAEAIKAAKGGTLLEIGPGPGVDYERYFRSHVQAGAFKYWGYEGSLNLALSLEKRFPEAFWHNETIADLLPLTADVVYARHVLEHQPALEPAFGLVLGAARKVAVITWYRPPGPTAFAEVWQGVHCRTYQRSAALQSVSNAGFHMATSELFTSGDECWVLERR